MHWLSRLELEDDLQMEIEQWGQGERPLVLVHGFTGSRDDWRERLPELDHHGLTIAIDQRGHGGSTNSGDPAVYVADQLARDLLRALDALEIERCDLLGHSMGGLVVQQMTRLAPERVASLILMDTFARGMSLTPAPVRASLHGLIDSQGMAGLADAMERAGRAGRSPRAPALEACIEEIGDDRYYARIRAKLLAMDPVAFKALGEMMASWPGVGDGLREIGCPATVLVGAQDTPFLEHAAELAEALPYAKHVVIPDAAHSPQLENPDAWLTAIGAHLAHARG